MDDGVAIMGLILSRYWIYEFFFAYRKLYIEGIYPDLVGLACVILSNFKSNDSFGSQTNHIRHIFVAFF